MTRLAHGRWRTCAAVTALALGLSACGGAATSGGESKSAATGGGGPLTKNCPDTGAEGLTDTTIKIGVSQPLSGPLVAVGGGFVTGMQAYFNYVNSTGGILGPDGTKRKVEIIAKDDQYIATKGKANIQELINDDKVFALLGLFGTSVNLAARPVIQQNCVPSLFATSGAPELGNPAYPWGSPGGSVSYLVEARASGQNLKSVNPNAKVAILQQDDDLGRAYVQGFKEGIAGSDITIVKKETFESTDPDVANQMTSLAASGADTFYDIAIGLTALQALNHAHADNWKPRIIQAAQLGVSLLNKLNPGAGDGLVIATSSYDADDPANANRPAVKLFREWYAKTPGHDKLPASLASGGWTNAQLLAWSITHAKTMTRAGVMESAHSLDVTESTMFLDGIKLHTGPGDDYLVEGVIQQKFDRKLGKLVPFGTVTDLNGNDKYEKITG